VNVFDVYEGETLNYINVGEGVGVDKATLKRFKRGEFVIEAILDLHGYTSDEAYDKVESFIKNCYLYKKRCVQIITGKGLHKDDEDIFSVSGVLKDLVPKWLNTDNLRPLILLFDYSRQEDGGEGALTILLRRKR
jgi:DNA-nicking Smr family endonuclease